MNYGTNIRRLREKSGMPREVLAAKLGLSYSMLCQIERGTKPATMNIAAEIAEIFNVDIRSLYI